MEKIPSYPRSCEITLDCRQFLHDKFRLLAGGISEFTFANIYLFRDVHKYSLSMLEHDRIVILGEDDGEKFFMLPFGLCDEDELAELFSSHSYMKCATAAQGQSLEEYGYTVAEDRDNFDYIYSRRDLAELGGRKFHKKKNHVNALLDRHEAVARPLLDEYVPDAMEVLEKWRQGAGVNGDYGPAKEALERMNELVLCGAVYYVDGKPAAWCLGEEVALGWTYAIHFEKALRETEMQGIYQYASQAFAMVLPMKYQFINREQDLGIEGLRKAKMSYNPTGFVRKYRVTG